MIVLLFPIAFVGVVSAFLALSGVKMTDQPKEQKPNENYKQYWREKNHLEASGIKADLPFPNR